MYAAYTQSTLTTPLVNLSIVLRNTYPRVEHLCLQLFYLEKDLMFTYSGLEFSLYPIERQMFNDYSRTIHIPNKAIEVLQTCRFDLRKANSFAVLRPSSNWWW